jgi:hypothetical protein
MEHREPPRRDHRLSILRVMIASAGFLGAAFLGARATQTTVAWLQDQDEYQLPFRSIQLVSTKPPDWYRGGAADFLEKVRQYAREKKILPVLRLEPGRIKLAFQKHPLVGSVVRVTYPPRGVGVELEFREPVAWVQVSPTERYLVDEKARILPPEEVDLDRLVSRHGRLIAIGGMGLSGPADPRPGAIWRPKPGITDLAEGNGRIPDAAQLAGFLAREIRALPTPCPPALDIQWIWPMDPQGRGLFIWNAEATWILWGEAPGQESAGSLTAEEKWAALRQWSETTKTRRLPPRHYYVISKSGSQYTLTDPLAASDPAGRPDPGPVAAGSGQNRSRLSH